jgi:ribonuclease P protein component
VAFAIGRWAGHAVDRNRIRRRLRAAVAEHGARLVAGTAYLFSAERDAVSVPFATLSESVGELIRAAGRRP